MGSQITLTARLTPSALDTRRGVVRLHREVLDALGLRQWDAVQLTGARVSAALAAEAGGPTGVILLDDVTMSNIGVTEGSEVVVSPVEVAPARSVTVAGSRLATTSLTPETVRLALVGKVLTVGDAVSLLPQDLSPPPGSDVSAVRGKLSRAIGTTWTNELLTVTATDPAGAATVHPSTVVGWRDGPRTGDRPVRATGQAAQAAPSGQGVQVTAQSTRAGVESVGVAEPEQAPVPIADLVGAGEVARTLGEWFELAFTRPELLAKLGAAPRLGVLVTGPEGVGKSTLVRAVAHTQKAAVVELVGPTVAVLEANTTAARVEEAIAAVRAHADAGTPVVLLIADLDALLPATAPPPVATVVLDSLRAAVKIPRVALVATTAHPEAVDPRVRGVELIDRELSLPLPDGKTRTELLRVLFRDVPVVSDVDFGAVAERTPGFVAADLIALRRESAIRAALRHQDGDPRIESEDLFGALDTVRPTSMSTSDTLRTGGISLDDVGDMAETKQALTEAVLWPLRYPDSFARLGVAPPRGVLLYGPPGGGKTFLVRAMAGTGQLNVLSVKGAELMDKWVGESERAVRDLFRRAAEAAPALIFLDEIDALAPRRGQSSDSGVSDRVVAALLTELDGVEPLRDVVVIGATNRPELVDPALLRPGRLERLIYVPPPDADARAAILKATARNTPLAPDVDLDEYAKELDGYSAADCTALIREAALTAMRESMDAAEVTAAHLAAARAAVGPSLDPAQVAALAAYAETRGS
ncbi:Cell division protein FtsH [Alloactinosynnema sp. L-07]|uniref:AAA family ATPase n=1 Tax=Alloactinosynnema sp. L-07 TaxID=1653480 RepID=UPI00065F0525|nr:AAA family ATPase [Alloactinosynnema sp. L-07]CRK61252.1 Cell division protein FtsH [Alloactinosynnema sp. L-07]